jgi:hypothetical protein
VSSDLTAPEVRLQSDITRELRGDGAIPDTGTARLCQRAAETATALAHMLGLPLLGVIVAEKADPTGIFDDFAAKSRDLTMLLHALRPRSSPLAQRILERAEATLSQLEGVPAE